MATLPRVSILCPPIVTTLIRLISVAESVQSGIAKAGGSATIYQLVLLQTSSVPISQRGQSTGDSFSRRLAKDVRTPQT